MTRLEILQQSRDICFAQINNIREALANKSDELRALEFAIKIELQDEYTEEQINAAISNNANMPENKPSDYEPIGVI